jgi:hypothetical protein
MGKLKACTTLSSSKHKFISNIILEIVNKSHCDAYGKDANNNSAEILSDSSCSEEIFQSE